MSECLVVIDVQNSFVTEPCRSIIPIIKQLLEHFTAQKKPVVFTQFINQEGSPFRRWIHWDKVAEPPEIDLIDEFVFDVAYVMPKYFYSAFNEEFKQFIRSHHIQTLYICGVATESCVLKTALDAFEYGIRPVVFEDACYSHAGKEAHQAGLLAIKRNIGKEQVILSQAVLG